MIDARYITNFRRSEEELQGFLLFGMAVAGKNADVAARSVNRLLKDIPDPVFWHYWRLPETLEEDLRQVRIGQYGKLHRGVMQLACTLAGYTSVETLGLPELMKIHGIGPKTARFFILHSRPHARLAVLDVHILSWLRKRGWEVPETSTPQRPARYYALERLFLSEIEREFPGKSAAEADLMIWLLESGRLLDGV
jgi:thermostable 8-oxoguanine DNA glycosylase